MIDNSGIKVTDKHVFFWGSWLSNWYKTEFKVEYNNKVITFKTSEQFFMFRKAMEFNDVVTANKILSTNNPREAKKLGRQVKNFTNEHWDKVKHDIMKTACFHKFVQNDEIRKELISPKYQDKTFVEASPYDKVWGIGMSMDNPDADNESKWLGENLLGKCLTELKSLFTNTNKIGENIKWE